MTKKKNDITIRSSTAEYLTYVASIGDQVNRNVKHYNLQMIIAIGFKVNNERAVQFPVSKVV